MPELKSGKKAATVHPAVKAAAGRRKLPMSFSFVGLMI